MIQTLAEFRDRYTPPVDPLLRHRPVTHREYGRDVDPICRDCGRAADDYDPAAVVPAAPYCYELAWERIAAAEDRGEQS